MKSEVILVSGLPRSGTSLMMQVLVAGGLTPLVDNQRPPDKDNPAGYFEYQPVKDLPNDNSWIKKTKGKVLKIVSPLLCYLPDNLNYKVIFMERDLGEILVSQEKMMARKGTNHKISNKEIKKQFAKHLAEIKLLFKKKPNFEVLYISYFKTVNNPQKTIEQLNKFLKYDLDVEKMVNSVKPDLYRNRSK